MRQELKRYGAALLIGMVGMGVFQGGLVLARDWWFLHQARLFSEAQATQASAQARPQASPAPAPAPTPAPVK